MTVCTAYDSLGLASISQYHLYSASLCSLRMNTIAIDTENRNNELCTVVAIIKVNSHDCTQSPKSIDTPPIYNVYWEICISYQPSKDMQTQLILAHDRVRYTVNPLKLPLWSRDPLFIDNHNSGYLGMAVQLYVQAHLGQYHMLIQKVYRQKLMAHLKSTPLFYLNMQNLDF